jgi:asparagine synthase (glutamine-hydrolysing)
VEAPTAPGAVRDPLGSRPLVYTEAGGGHVAEHERELLDRLPATPGADALALKSWIDRGVFPAGRTLYEGIRKVPAGHRVTFGAGAARIERHWSPRYRGTISGSREEIAARLREQVFAAVARAAAGPGLTTLRLSGGLDSAAVAAALADGGVEAVALSAVFPDHPETDERPLIEATAATTGLAAELVELEPGTSILPAALDHIERWRLPPVSPNLFVWAPVMERARRLGAARMLDGEGGDELFGAVSALIADRLRSGRLASAWELCGRIPGAGDHPARALRLRALRRFGVKPLIPAGLLRRRRRGAALDPGGSLLAAADRIALAELDEDRRPADGPLWWRALVADVTGGDELGVAGHLRREEVDGGVERWHPFLYDLELVEAVLALPPELAFDPRRDRPLLRDALAGRVPASVLEGRGKARFNPLLHEALAGPEGDWLEAGLREGSAPVRGYLDGAAVDRVIAAGRSAAAAGDELRLWRLGVADLWLRSLSGG